MSAYDTLELKPTWGGGSVAAFGLIVVFLTGVVAAARVTPGGFHAWAGIVFIVVPFLSAIGLVLGIMGLRRIRGRGGAALGVILNFAVLLSVVVALITG